MMMISSVQYTKTRKREVILWLTLLTILFGAIGFVVGLTTLIVYVPGTHGSHQGG